MCGGLWGFFFAENANLKLRGSQHLSCIEGRRNHFCQSSCGWINNIWAYTIDLCVCTLNIYYFQDLTVCQDTTMACIVPMGRFRQCQEMWYFPSRSPGLVFLHTGSLLMWYLFMWLHSLQLTTATESATVNLKFLAELQPQHESCHITA